ncbi:sulfurase [Gilvimarinus sp. SDUM040013]|uniref:Sulfurase n=1 Tax=Gilvimarinus gilvus TaxID=3058038 RepID=A0ABU4RZ76_9GAMM|nr:sulfurase [Gilvimarinus sp. SDUM040013]MDO3387549.1 sulfurase [Gilvimarinus sp. SDUM040013]MDX6850186.1 sulfurase [Gilvimarinus sp. SDUM040013]
MNVERIFICPEHGMELFEFERITVKTGLGVVGDRNFGKSTHPGQNITLVEAEEIELFCSENQLPIDLTITRRNIVTRGVRLNSLENKEFSIGTVRLRGVELCEPCSLLAENLSTDSLPAKEVIRRWLQRGGLRADVLSNGEIIRGSHIATIAKKGTQ